jgi:outer membrane protein TolC
LDQVKTSQIRSGYAEMSQAQAQAEQSRLRDVGLTWSETVEKASQLKKQLEILRSLEVLQRKKADSERNKLNRGRSTTFQVLNFEQDYNSARNQRINLEFQARQFINSLALYK